MAQIIDSHLHLDLIYKRQPDTILWMKENSYRPVSWAFGAKIDTTADLLAYLDFQKETIHQISDTGLPCYFLAGIHPRNIPDDLETDRIPRLLGPYIDDPLCLGMGEIGLETGSRREIDVLVAQMEMGYTILKNDKIFGIHTPRDNKPAITQKLLATLAPFLNMKDHMVVDHCTPETIGEVLKWGYWAGITVSPIKSSASDVIEILSTWPEHLHRIMVNTDSGGRFYKDLHNLSANPQIEATIKRQILKDNAASFFRISPMVKSR